MPSEIRRWRERADRTTVGARGLQSSLQRRYAAKSAWARSTSLVFLSGLGRSKEWGSKREAVIRNNFYRLATILAEEKAR